MLERLEKELELIQQEQQQTLSQRNQLQQGLMLAEQRLYQLQGAYERISKFIEEVKQEYAAQDTSGPDRPVETPEVRDHQDVATNV